MTAKTQAETGVWQRVQELAAHVGSVAKLAKLSGVKDSALRSVINRKGGIASESAVALIKATGCSADWLLRGQGEMFDNAAGERPAIPTYITGGGNHWVVSEDLQPYSIRVPTNLVGYQVDGDSMAPLARHGQIVLALRGEKADDGDLAVVQLKDGSHTFKRVQIQKGMVVLVPVNQVHRAEVVKPSEIVSAWKVWGVKL